MTRHHLEVPADRSSALLDRRSTVMRILEDRSDELVISSLGAPCWDAAACGDRDINFYVWGAMGTPCMVALGLAIARPERRIIAIVGDGDLLMGLGSLATIAVAQARNLGILVLDNGRYGDTGNQPTHTAAGVDIAGIGRAAGFSRIMLFSEEQDIAAAKSLLLKEEGPVLVVAKVASEKSSTVLPPRDGTLLKHRFRQAVLGSSA